MFNINIWFHRSDTVVSRIIDFVYNYHLIKCVSHNIVFVNFVNENFGYDNKDTQEKLVRWLVNRHDGIYKEYLYWNQLLEAKC